MSNKKSKYNGSNMHKRAILHMIGESVATFKSKPTVAEIASWMHVSKTTALRHLKKMLKNKEIVMIKTRYRPNNFKWVIELDDDIMEQYYMNMFHRDYKFYSHRILRIEND